MKLCHELTAPWFIFSKSWPRQITLAGWLPSIKYYDSRNGKTFCKFDRSFIVTVYAPEWFSTKTNPKTYQHIFQLIPKSQYLGVALEEVVDPVIQRNVCFFWSPKNFVLAMLHDDRNHIRDFGIRQILKSRQSASPRTIGKFKAPSLNFECNDYT